MLERDSEIDTFYNYIFYRVQTTGTYYLQFKKQLKYG